MTFSARGGPAFGWETLKKHFHSYAKGFDGAKELREQLMKSKDANEVRVLVEGFLKNVV